MSFKYSSPDACFSCKLVCKRCTADTKTGAQCARTTRKQLPYCFQHTRSLSHLDLRPSTLPGAGTGVFALKTFEPNEEIVTYTGEVLTKDEIEARYGQDTAPYALRINRNHFIDAACARGTGSLINTNPGHNNARFKVSRTGKASIIATRRIPSGSELFVDYGPRADALIAPEPSISYSTSSR